MKMKILMLTLICITARSALALTCIGENGKHVDWFVAYKLPRGADVPVEKGFGYAYLDATTDGFKLSKFAVTDTKSAMGATLQQVYGNAKAQENEMAYIFYNDESPDARYYSSHGHSKGDVAFNGETGFWLIHSIPKYPNYIKDGYGYPHSGGMYGQMFFCVTFNSSQMDSIGLQLRYIDPHIHDSNLPRSMAQQFPNVNKLLQDDVITTEPYNRTARLVSSLGVDLLHFGKNKNFGMDLYYSLVAPSLKTNLLTETWQHGSSKIGPSCDGFTVEDITQISVQTDAQTFEFSNYADHAKFAVSKSGSYYVCIGDINRMETQFKRGGGTLCTSNEKLWSHFRKLASSINSCNTKDFKNYDYSN